MKDDAFQMWFKSHKAIRDMKHAYYKEIGDMYYKQNIEMLQAMKFGYMTFILGIFLIALAKFL